MFLLSEQHVSVVAAKAETALQRGEDLLRWWNATEPPRTPIAHTYGDVTMEAFFAGMKVEGIAREGMGCLQTSTFRPGPGVLNAAPVNLRAWVMENALRECFRPNGEGFRYQPLLGREAGAAGAVKRLSDSPSIALAAIGTKYDWVVQSLGLPDYALAFPLPRPIASRMRSVVTESGALIFHSSFNRSTRPPLPGAVDEVTFGYAVVPWKAERSILGFGPGTFYSAMKQYRVYLMPDHSVVIEVVFIVCPRSEKILDIGGFDPVYGAARLLNALTLGRTGIVKKVHDTIDNYALGHHGRVHVHMLEGMRSIWEGTHWSGSPGNGDRVSAGAPGARAAEPTL